MKKFYNNKDLDIIYDLPTKVIGNKKNNIKYKKKFLSNYWPFLPPTSCISMRKIFFKKIFSLVSNKKFPDIWMDFRIVIAAKYLFKQYNIIEKNLTFYRQINTNISSKFRFLSQNWWIRRKQAHTYIKYFFTKNNIIYTNNFDYFLTQFVNFFIK